MSTIPSGNKPISAVWSMKRKHNPARNIIKWKARLCTHGGHKIQGMYYWDTYLPVVYWSTVHLMLILGIIMGWRMRLLDFVLTFPQAEIKTDIFMKILHHCLIRKSNWKENVLKLKKTSTVFATQEGHGTRISLKGYLREGSSSQTLTRVSLSRKR